MRWGPQEQHDGEDQRRGRQRRAGGGGAGHDGKTAGEPPDDDVHPGPALQPDGVHDAVGECAQKDICGGFDVRRHRRDDHGSCQKTRQGGQPVAVRVEFPGDERALARALHARVEIAFVELVECAGDGRGDERRHAEQEHLPRSQDVARADGHTRQRAGHDQEAEPDLRGLVYQFDCRTHLFVGRFDRLVDRENPARSRRL